MRESTTARKKPPYRKKNCAAKLQVFGLIARSPSLQGSVQGHTANQQGREKYVYYRIVTKLLRRDTGHIPVRGDR
jgi:hypothetical protein